MHESIPPVTTSKEGRIVVEKALRLILEVCPVHHMTSVAFYDFYLIFGFILIHLFCVI
jgi:hypothetical protein